MLGIDIGVFHTVVTHWKHDLEDENDYNVYLFKVGGDFVKDIVEKLDRFPELLQAKIAVIEQQLPLAPKNYAIMYVMYSYFYMKGMEVKIQNAKKKYRIFQANDQRNNKNNAVIYVQQHCMHQVYVRYNEWDRVDVPEKKHIYGVVLYSFLKQYKLQKFDDIADTILMIQAEDRIVE